MISLKNSKHNAVPSPKSAAPSSTPSSTTASAPATTPATPTSTLNRRTHPIPPQAMDKPLTLGANRQPLAKPIPQRSPKNINQAIQHGNSRGLSPSDTPELNITQQTTLLTQTLQQLAKKKSTGVSATKKDNQHTLTAAAEALLFASGYAMRRSKGMRKKGISLCDEVILACCEEENTEIEIQEMQRSAKLLRAVLRAEELLQRLSGDATVDGCVALMTELDRQEEKKEEENSVLPWHSLAKTTLANGLIQLASHFPKELAASQLTVADTLERAFHLAEEALVINPNNADAFCILGRLFMMQGLSQPTNSPQVNNELGQGNATMFTEARQMLEHTLVLEPEHDPAEIALATIELANHSIDSAQERCARVLKRGNGLPQPLLLRAQIALKQNNPKVAKGDLERAILLAPDAGLLYLDAAEVAEVLGDETSAKEFKAEAHSLLGHY